MIKKEQALLVIDVQNEYFTGRLPVTFPKDSFSNIIKAMDYAEDAGIPVVVIQHTAPSPDSLTFKKGSREWRLHPEIKKRKYNVLIEKTLPDGFTGTELEKWLKNNDVRRIVICGYMTQMCCDTTARQVFNIGFQVIFLADVTGALSINNDAGSISDRDLHRAILVTQGMRFSEVMKTVQWISQSSDIMRVGKNNESNSQSDKNLSCSRDNGYNS